VARIGALVTALVLVSVALPTAAEARRAPREFIGIQSWNIPTQREFDRMGRAGVRTFRINLLWSVVEYQRGARNWELYDQIVASAARSGIRVLPALVGSPRFAARKFEYPPRGRANTRRFARFITEAVRRYGTRGTFWAANRGLPYRPAKWWQVWNEPNFRGYWNGRPSARGYAKLLRTARRAIKRADRRARIVLAGLPETRLGIPMRRYLPRLYRARARRLFDAVAVHPYARDHRGVMASVRRARRIMRRYRDRRKAIWLTEVGWATGGRVGKTTRKFKTSRRGQARRLRRTLSAVTRARRRYRIAKLVWFSWRDRPPNPRERSWWAIHTGLFTRSGHPKPAWPTLVRFTGGAAGSGPLDTLPGPSPPPAVPAPPGGQPPSGPCAILPVPAICP
jgi:hypothetical protein